ncbi:MAG: N-acetylmuramoyl-L-alanine amidase [Mycobacteriales bacterium]
MAHGSLRRLGLRGLLVAGLTATTLALPAHAYRDVERPATLRAAAPVSEAAVVPGFPIDYVGVIWSEEESAHAHAHAEGADESFGEVRFRHGSTWGDWIPLQPDGADAPGQWTSGLLGGRDADAFQVRGLPDHAGTPRAVALNTTDGPLEVVRRVADGPQALSSCRSRAEWGADESLMTWAPDFHPAQVMTVHHTATSNGDTDPEATVRAIYEYHAVDNGWGDIGYHYLVDQYGVVYEGRWSGTASETCTTGAGADFAHEAGSDRMATAAHTGGYNSGNLGVALLGDFTYHRRNANTPTSAATSSLTDVLAELSHRHGIAADGTVAYVNPVDGGARSVDAVSGHRDWASTECPGDNLYAMLPDLRAEVVAKVAAMETGPGVAFTAPVDGSTVSATAPVEVTAEDGAVSVEFGVDGTLVHTDTDASDGWGFGLDTTAYADGTHQLSAVATDIDGGTGSAAVSVTVDNVADPEITVSVVDLDAHTHTRGARWDAHAVVQVADSAGNALPDAWVSGTFSGDGISPTDASCQIDATRCELHLDGLDERTVTSVTFTVTGVQDDAGVYDAAKNTDPETDSNPRGTTILIAL